MDNAAIKDITEERLRQKNEKERVIGLIKEIYGKKAKINDRGDFSTLEVKLRKVFRKKLIMHLNISVGSVRVYGEEYSLKHENFVKNYRRIVKDGLVTAVSDYSKLTPGT